MSDMKYDTLLVLHIQVLKNGQRLIGHTASIGRVSDIGRSCGALKQSRRKQVYSMGKMRAEGQKSSLVVEEGAASLVLILIEVATMLGRRPATGCCLLLAYDSNFI